MKNVLLVSIFVTNKSLSSPGNLGHSRTGSSVERLEIFLSSLRSWSKLAIENSYFFVELDDEFLKYQGLVAEEIATNFVNPVVKWQRLLYFQDWFDISLQFEKEKVDLVTLMANDDHAYIHTNPKPFADFCSEVLEIAARNDGRALGDLTQLPGPVRLLDLYSTFSPETGDSRRSFKVTTIHGCSLVTAKLFKEWWIHDFTEGKRIPRPDNPFGPSVKFEIANVLVPPVELLRHLDGIGAGTKISRKYNVLRPSCRLVGPALNESESRHVSLQEIPWTYSLWPASPYSHNRNGGPDFYRMYPEGNSLIERFRVDLSRLIVAFQRAYVPQLSREFIVDRTSNRFYIVALNLVILFDFETFFNFVIWLVFDLPNRKSIMAARYLFGERSFAVTLLKKIRNRIFQHLTVRILKHSRLFRN